MMLYDVSRLPAASCWASLVRSCGCVDYPCASIIEEVVRDLFRFSMSRLNKWRCLRSPNILLESAAHRASKSLASIASEVLSFWLRSLPPGIDGSMVKYCWIAARMPAKQVLVLIQFCGLNTRLADRGSFAAASRAVFKQIPAMSTTWSTMPLAWAFSNVTTGPARPRQCG